jgi:hypothetical protein
MENRKVKQVLSRGWNEWEGGRQKERVREAEHSGNSMYLCMKMEK